MNQPFSGQWANVYKIKSNKLDKEYILSEQVGSGTEGIVYKGEEISSTGKEMVAIKMQRSLNQQNIIEKFAEKSFTNLINVRDIVINSQGSYVVMDYADGEFYKYMQSEEYKSKTHREKCDLFIQIVQGVEELHEIKMIHRDLKPENILYIRKNGTIQLKLCDFGLIKYNIEDATKTANIGTPYYWAPEMISPQIYANYSEKVDIWALGMMWHEMITGKPMLIDFQQVQNIKQHLISIDQKWINDQIDKVVQLLPQEKDILKTNMLTKNPFQRISAKQIKEKLIELKKPFVMQNQQQFPQKDFAPNLNPNQSFQKQQVRQSIQQQQFAQPGQGITYPINQQQKFNNNFKNINPQGQIQQIQQQIAQPISVPQISINPSYTQQNQSFVSNPKEFKNSRIFAINVNLDKTISTQQKEIVKQKIDEMERQLLEKENKIQLIQGQNKDLSQKFQEFLQMQKLFEQQKDLFQSQLENSRKQFELDLVQLNNRTQIIENNIKIYKSISTKNQNENINKEQQFQQEIKQIQQQYDQKITELNQKLQKQFEEKEQVMKMKFEIDSEFKVQQCKENNLIEKIDQFLKQKDLLEKQILGLQKNIEDKNYQIQQKEIDFQLLKQKQEQSILDLNKENNKLLLQLKEKEQEQKLLPSTHIQQQTEYKKMYEIDLSKEKKNTLHFLIKNIQQILQFQQIFISDKLKKFNISQLEDQSPEKQYVQFLIPLHSEQQKQTDHLKRIEQEFLGSEPNTDQLNELLGSVQKIVLDIGYNITKNYQQIQNYKFILKERKEQRVQGRSPTDSEVEKLKRFQLILNEVQQNFHLLTNQLIKKSPFDDHMKYIWKQAMLFQNQFETEFFQAFQSQVKQQEQTDPLNILDQILQRYLQNFHNLQEQVNDIKTLQLENDVDWIKAEEICRLQDELKKLERQNYDLNVKIADFPDEIKNMKTEVGLMIGLIQQLKNNEKATIQQAKKEYDSFAINSQNKYEVKLILHYYNLSELLDIDQSLRKQQFFIEDISAKLNQNKLIIEEKYKIETNIKNQNKKIKLEGYHMKCRNSYLKVYPPIKPPFRY